MAGPSTFFFVWTEFLIGGPAPAGLIDSLSLDVHVGESALVGLNLFPCVGVRTGGPALAGLQL